LNYAVYATQWKADYIPSYGIGQMNSGNAILSKFPLNNAERMALPLIDSQSGLEKYFYLRRHLLIAETTVKGQNITLLNTHTSAYSTDGTKKLQLEKVKEKSSELASNGKTFILGGDFNNLAPNTQNYCNFNDDVCEGEFATQACDVLIEELPNMKIFIDDFNEAISQARYDADESKFYTFTSDKDGFWNRKLDYIFTNGNFELNSGLVHQDVSTGGFETMPLSDHAPVSVVYKLN